MLIELNSWQFIGIIIINIVFGILAAWFYFRNKINILLSENKHQNNILNDRENTIKSATDPLREIFHEMASKSLQKNSENFLLLAEQNLGKQQEKSKQELKRSEQAVQNLIDPIKEVLKESQ